MVCQSLICFSLFRGQPAIPVLSTRKIIGFSLVDRLIPNIEFLIESFQKTVRSVMNDHRNLNSIFTKILFLKVTFKWQSVDLVFERNCQLKNSRSIWRRVKQITVTLFERSLFDSFAMNGYTDWKQDFIEKCRISTRDFSSRKIVEDGEQMKTFQEVRLHQLIVLKKQANLFALEDLHGFKLI